MPPETIRVNCPRCGNEWQDWFRPSINLRLGEKFSKRYLREATSATCPRITSYNVCYTKLLRIEVKKESDEEKNSVQLIFNINEGEQTLIREINFNGNNLFANDNKLRSLIATKKKTLFENGVYKEDVIQSDILTIEGYYHSNGYINAKVIDVKTTIEDDENKPQTKNMYIDFFIEEGDVYTYGGIKYNGNSIYTDAEFDKFEFMKFGDVYNKSSHEKRFIKIQSLYYDNGYIENSFHDQVDIDEENKIVSHVISIRITSYNVCYTKLLREGEKRDIINNSNIDFSKFPKDSFIGVGVHVEFMVNTKGEVYGAQVLPSYNFV